jgi:CRP-like cAMP-binding protein
MYVIQSGAVEYSYRQGDVETVLTILERGEFFGEMALFGEARRPATAKTTCSTRLLALNRALLLDRIEADPAVALHLLRGLYLRIQHADRQIQQAVENNEVLRLALAQQEDEDSPRKKAQAQPAAEAIPTADVSLPEMARLWDIDQESISFEPGQRIYSQGDPAEVLYVILEGAVEISAGSGMGKYVLFRFYPGDFFGE